MQALLGALAAFHDKADFSFQATHFGAGFVQQALGLVDLVARRVVGLAHVSRSASIGASRPCGSSAFTALDPHPP
jgi:hypothetical protein